MRLWIFAAIGALVSLGAEAQQASPSGPTCGVSDFILTASSPADAVTKIRGKCQPGDTVFIELANVFVIASICDLAKSTITTQRHVYCAVSQPKGNR